MKNYLKLLDKILTYGIPSEDRTGTGTLSLFSESLKFDMSKGFPIVTTKYVNYDAVLKELLWFISGDTNINNLDSKIWNEWATESGSIGPMYGYQWRNWDGIDQLKETIINLKVNPYSRRHVISAWNVRNLPYEGVKPQVNVDNGKMALAPCHHFYQFYVRQGKLNLHFSMRSTDAFLGLPFNIASYATLLIMVSNLVGLTPGILSYHGVDIHLYMNHIEQVKEQLSRESFELPHLHVCSTDSIDNYTADMFTLIDYRYHPKLYGKISV
ncbi:MAG: thymidylate synthase [Desulfobacteraceae bacterium]|nr:thymidylate synthase [Desulfobacteraceae bacterium]